jgi:hypothetical protein
MEALKVWLTDSMNIPSFVPHWLSRWLRITWLPNWQSLNNKALRFDFVVTVVNIAESYGIMVIEFRVNYRRLRKICKMWKFWKLDGRTVLMCLQVMEQIKLRIRDNRIKITDQMLFWNQIMNARSSRIASIFFLACCTAIKFICETINMVLVCFMNSDPKRWIDWK